MKATLNIKVSAAILETRLRNWLDNGNRGEIGKVYNTFDRVINLLSKDQQILFSIATNTVPLSPYMLLLKGEPHFDFLTIKVDEPVQFLDNQLIVSNLLIDLNKSEMVSLQLGEVVRNSRDYRQWIQKIDAFVKVNGTDGGCKIFYQPNREKATMFEQALLVNLYQLKAAHHFQTQLTLLKKQIGLGIGLTPSGDDFLAGYLYTIAALNPVLWSDFEKEKEAFLLLSRKRTTGIGFHMLKNIFEKTANQYLFQLMQRIGRNETEIELELADLLSIGSSSGTDMLVGVRFALDYLEKQEDLCELKNYHSKKYVL